MQQSEFEKHSKDVSRFKHFMISSVDLLQQSKRALKAMVPQKEKELKEHQDIIGSLMKFESAFLPEDKNKVYSFGGDDTSTIRMSNTLQEIEDQ